MPHSSCNKVIFSMSLLYGLDPGSTSVEAVEDLVEKELVVHNKANIQVSKTLCYIHSKTNLL